MPLVMIRLLAATLWTDPTWPFQSTTFLLRQRLRHQMAHLAHDGLRLRFVLIPRMRPAQRGQLPTHHVREHWHDLGDHSFYIHVHFLDGVVLSIRMCTSLALLLLSLPPFDSHPFVSNHILTGKDVVLSNR